MHYNKVSRASRRPMDRVSNRADG